MKVDTYEPIAIIGASCRLSGEASSMSGLWDMIKNGRNAHSKIPADRWDADSWHHPDPDRKGSLTTKHGYFLSEDISKFDAPFFSTTAAEAASLDPMKRLLMEVSYETWESAGIPLAKLVNSKTGVYVGCMTNDYETLSTYDVRNIGQNAAAANSEAMIANRVSWWYGLRGPSLTLDTACSSSLYALHLACQSLRLRETDMALVAGVNLILHPNFMHQLTAMHMLSPDGISHTFDSRANGYGRGEGIGAIAVKRLNDAVRDGDTIRAVIRATAIDSDGKTSVLTQPSAEAQADLIRRTYDVAGLRFEETQYVECHGTGTPIGDPIELSAIASTLGTCRSAQDPLLVGSVKPNLGHTEGCSGLVAVLKAIHCLENGILVPTPGIININAKLKLSDWNLKIPTQCIRWPIRGPRRISINSFGFGGANAHAILDDAGHYLRHYELCGNHVTNMGEDDDGESQADSAVSVGAMSPSKPSFPCRNVIFTFSARDAAGIARIASAYSTVFENKDTLLLDHRYMYNLAHTLSSGRSHFDFRGFAVASSVPNLVSSLRKGLVKVKRSPSRDNVIFVFTGQGAAWPGMGLELMAHSAFAESLNLSQEYLIEAGCSWDLVDVLSATAESSKVGLAEFDQVLCTALQIALVDLFRRWGVKPRASIGHSSGEIAAAYASGLLSHRDAVRVAYFRGICSAKVESLVKPLVGRMLAAGVSETEAQSYLSKVPDGTAVLACVNSPQIVTLSGNMDALDQLEKALIQDGKFARILRVDTAYHSPHMQTVSALYVKMMSTIAPRPIEEQIGVMYSSVTTSLVTSADLGPEYWARNMCECVRFSSTLDKLLRHRDPKPIRWSAVLEMGPHSALRGPILQTMATGTKTKIPYHSALNRGEHSEKCALTTIGNLWASGHNVSLERVNGLDEVTPPPMILPDLPPYPWNHSKSYWHESAISRSIRYPSAPRTDLLGTTVELLDPAEPEWHNELSIAENPWIQDHRITGTVLYPGAGMLIMAMEAVKTMVNAEYELKGFSFDHVSFEHGLSVNEDDSVKTRLKLVPTTSSRFKFIIYSLTWDGTWMKHCQGTIGIEYDLQPTELACPDEQGEMYAGMDWIQVSQEFNDVKESSTHDMDIRDFYDNLETMGMEYGPLFRNAVFLRAAPTLLAAHGSISVPDTKSIMPSEFEFDHVIQPATLDACFHLLFAALEASSGKRLNEAAVPLNLEHMFIAATQPSGCGDLFTGYSRVTANNSTEIAGDIVLSDENWIGPKILVQNFVLRKLGNSGVSTDAHKICARIEWSEESDLLNTSLSGLKLPENLHILRDPEASEAAKKLETSLVTMLEENGVSVTLGTITQYTSFMSNSIISLVEIETPFIREGWTAEQLSQMKTLMLSASHMLWLTRGGLLKGWADNGLAFSSTQGVLRVLRNEYERLELPHLDLSREFDLENAESARLIFQVWLSTLGPTEDGLFKEMEFAESEGKLYIPRAVEEPSMDGELALHEGRARTTMSDLHCDTPLKISASPNNTGELVWVEDVQGLPLGEDEVEIAVQTVGLNGCDIGSKTTGGNIGYEAIGKVTKCGARVENVTVGQTVAVLGLHTCRTHVRQHKSLVHVAVPEMRELMPRAFVAAQYALVEVARLTEGQSILIHGAAGGLGQAAVQIAQAMGVKVFATVSSADKMDLLVKQYALLPEQIFNSRRSNFVLAIMRRTAGKGVDAVLHSRSAISLEASMACLSGSGCLLMLDRDSASPGVPVSKRNASISRIDINRLAVEKPTVIESLLKNIFELAKGGKICPLSPATVMSVTDLEDALTQLRNRDHYGQLVIALGDEQSQVPRLLTHPPEFELSSTGTYILAGGLGALGIRMAKMMFRHGAGHVVLLSRSGGASSKYMADFEDLKGRGFGIEIMKCDATSSSQVNQVFAHLGDAGRMIKGIVQCAMVLDDAIFDNVTQQQWATVTTPKISGTMNLHNATLHDPLDFFILLSSITCIMGNPAQSAYSAGNTFMDAFAAWRHRALGLPTTSIDVGLVSDSTHFDGPDFDIDAWKGHYSHGWVGAECTVADLEVVLKAAMAGKTADGMLVPPQIILGLGSELRRDGDMAGQWTRDRKFDLRVTGGQGLANNKADIGQLLSTAESMEDATRAVEMALKETVAAFMGVDTDEIDYEKPLFEYGVDSLKAAEMRNRIFRTMQSQVSVFEILSPAPMSRLAVEIASRSRLLPPQVAELALKDEVDY